jgi:hypothetical protein
MRMEPWRPALEGGQRMPGRPRRDGTGLRGVALGDTQVVDGRDLPSSELCVRMSGIGQEELSMMDQAG